MDLNTQFDHWRDSYYKLNTFTLTEKIITGVMHDAFHLTIAVADTPFIFVLYLCKLTRRASNSDYNDFKVARILISICKNSDPFTLFHVLLSNIIIETRRQQRPWFVDSSRSRIGRQYLANRVTTISKMLDYDWLDDISKDWQRVQLKRIFYPRLA